MALASSSLLTPGSVIARGTVLPGLNCSCGVPCILDWFCSWASRAWTWLGASVGMDPTIACSDALRAGTGSVAFRGDSVTVNVWMGVEAGCWENWETVVIGVELGLNAEGVCVCEGVRSVCGE